MVDNENKSNNAIASVIENFEATIKVLKEQIANIDEEYRIKCEEAKKELAYYLQTAEGHLSFWKKLDETGTIPGTTKKTRKPRTKKSEEELPADERVIDEQAVVSEVAQEEEQFVNDNVSTEEETEFVETSSNDADGSLFNEDKSVVEEPETIEESFEEVVEKDNAPEEEDWVEFPQPEEWN